MTSPWSKGYDAALGRQIAGQGRIMIIGTAHFVSFAAAVSYYRPYYDDTRAAVRDKILAGEIQIGRPELKDGEELVLMDGGKRYGIKTTT